MLPVMTTETEPADAVDPDRIDERVFLQGVTWEDYERLLEIRGESSVPRMTYLNGELELMSPSTDHERAEFCLARLLIAWSEEVGVPLEGYGHWTVRKRRVKRGAEADGCFVVGEKRNPKRPDIAIEVIWTRGGLSKLDVWRKLGVPEVWFWKDGALTFHVLRGDRYEPAERSDLLPALDPALFARCMAAPSQIAAVRELRETLRAR
jgi:Uma2 family endonuclease